MPKKIQTHDFPAFLSFWLPGMGQFVKGHVLKGIVILLINIALLVSPILLLSARNTRPISILERLFYGRVAFQHAFNFNLFVVISLSWLLTWFIFWLWNMHDAYTAN